MNKKPVTILISLLLCAFAVLEICIGHTVGKGRHYDISREPTQFWSTIAILIISALVVFLYGRWSGHDGG